MLNVFSKIFGTRNDREVKKYRKKAEAITAIESKYASLRFDYYFETPVLKIVEKLIDSLIYQAEDKSERICEYCGADGELREVKSGSWKLVSCDKCANERNDLVKMKEFGN